MVQRPYRNWKGKTASKSKKTKTIENVISINKAQVYLLSE